MAKGDDAPEFLPYGLTFHHKHVPEMQDLCHCSPRDPIMQPSVGNFAQGMIDLVPLQLADLDYVPTRRRASTRRSPITTPASTDSVSRSRPSPRSSALPDIDPERPQRTPNRMKLYVFANDDAGAGAAGRRLRQSRQGRFGRCRAEHGPDARPPFLRRPPVVPRRAGPAAARCRLRAPSSAKRQVVRAGGSPLRGNPHGSPQLLTAISVGSG